MTSPPSRQSAFQNAPMPDLLDILLRQFKRPLANFDIDLTAEDTERIAEQVAARQPLGEKAQSVRAGLVKVVEESETVLQGWELTFQQALQTPMDKMPNWETTADFLEVANEKSNAELRIAAASALLLAMDERRYRDYLTFLVENPSLDDVSAVMAERVLDFVEQGKG